METAPFEPDRAADLEALLPDVDAALAAEERRSEERRAEERRRLEGEHGRLADAIAKAEERIERARELGAGEVIARIEPRLEAARARQAEIVQALGYDPARRREEAERAAAEERARRERLADELAGVEGEVTFLETRVGGMPKPAIFARVHALACRAKLAQHEFRDLVTPDQHDRFRHLFARLRHVVDDTQCGYVPSLRQGWVPPSFPAEIERAEREYAEAMEGRAAGGEAPRDPAAEREEELKRAAERLETAERWVLAEVYRWSNACYERPGDAATVTRLREAALHAQHFLARHKEDLPLILRHDAALLEGGEFRWLRRKLSRLEEAAVAEAPEAEAPEAGAAEPEEAAGALETLTGERVLHPSVLRALPHTRGRKIVMVGGAVRAERRDKLHALFEAAAFEWVPFERGTGQRGIEQVTAQIRAGTPDLVVCLLGFMSHGVSQEILAAARASGVPCAVVPRGYGEVSIAHAILQACAAAV